MNIGIIRVFKKPTAIIYRPAKTAMQSGKGNTKVWLLEFEQQEGARTVDDLMGWTGSSDMNQELKLKFTTQGAAVAYAEKDGIEYRLIQPQKPKRIIKSYADNFTKQKG